MTALAIRTVRGKIQTIVYATVCGACLFVDVLLAAIGQWEPALVVIQVVCTLGAVGFATAALAAHLRRQRKIVFETEGDRRIAMLDGIRFELPAQVSGSQHTFDHDGSAVHSVRLVVIDATGQPVVFEAMPAEPVSGWFDAPASEAPAPLYATPDVSQLLDLRTQFSKKS